MRYPREDLVTLVTKVFLRLGKMVVRIGGAALMFQCQERVVAIVAASGSDGGGWDFCVACADGAELLQAGVIIVLGSYVLTACAQRWMVEVM